jgi:hypothetical protein
MMQFLYIFSITLIRVVGISISSEYQRAEGVEPFQMLLLFVGPQRGRRFLGRVVVSGGGPFLVCVVCWACQRLHAAHR